MGSLRAGAERLAVVKLGAPDGDRIDVTSAAFEPGQPLPRAATEDGDGLPPPIACRKIPTNARSLVLICEDADAPLPEPFVHWILYALPARDGVIDPASGVVGQNSALERGFTGAAPPPGHGVHHYHFQVFALDTRIDLEEGAGRGALFDEMRGHVVAWGDLVGTYERR